MSDLVNCNRYIHINCKVGKGKSTKGSFSSLMIVMVILHSEVYTWINCLNFFLDYITLICKMNNCVWLSWVYYVLIKCITNSWKLLCPQLCMNNREIVCLHLYS